MYTTVHYLDGMSASLITLLRLNAVFSAATSVGALLGARALADALVVPPLAVAVVGAGLFGFAAWLLTLSRRPVERLRGWGLFVAAADAGWVVASAVFVLLRTPTTAGSALVLSTSVVVASLAVAQLRAAQRLDPEEATVVGVTRDIAGATDDVWVVMTDSELYGRLAPNLSKVIPFTRGTDGNPRERRCWDLQGRHWDETCTSWRPGESFSVRVHTDAPDYPYPLAALRGSWSVASAGPSRSRVTVRFEFVPRPGPAGRAFAAAMTTVGPAVTRRIISGWEKATAARVGSAG